MTTGIISIPYKKWQLEVSCFNEHAGNIAVICLHGLQSNKNIFLPLSKPWADRGISTIGIDFIGFGNSSKPENFLYTFEEQTEIINRVIAQFNLSKFILIGHSMGGMFGTLLLKDLEKQLAGFINMEGNFVLKDCGASLSMTQTGFDEFSKKLYPEFLASLETSQEIGAELRLQCLKSTPDYAFYRTSQSIVEWSRSEKLIPLFVNSPVQKLFVYGEKNRWKKEVLPPTISSAEIPGAGHFMLSENPQETFRIIDDFVTRHLL
jgi:pimeloyl-ACP methyl ester carboxylesterase